MNKTPSSLTPRTPAHITAAINEFAKHLSEGEEPFFIDITAIPDMDVDRCHRNVQQLIDEKGGTIQFGWSIWVVTRGWLEAIFHSVWVAPDGMLVDPTPDADGERRRLFVVDRCRRFEGFCIPAVRQPLTNDRNIVGACKFLDIADQIQSRYAEGESVSAEDTELIMRSRRNASLLLHGIVSAQSLQRDHAQKLQMRSKATLRRKKRKVERKNRKDQRRRK